MMDSLRWNSWRPLTLSSPIPAATLPEQLDGGQAFRWRLSDNHEWLGVIGRAVVRLRFRETQLEWCSSDSSSAFAKRMGDYFDESGIQVQLIDQLPWRSDVVLSQAIRSYPGLRILRQDPHETLVGFLCSSNKRIQQIRMMVSSLAQNLGEPIAEDYYALPSWSAIASASATQLKSCALGYRAKFLQGTAHKLKDRPDWEKEFSSLPTPQLLETLQTLPGVGPKVAACVALFGFGRWESFPVDTWIVQVLTQAYRLQGYSAKQLEKFGQAHFGAAAGIAQQYLFASARSGQLGVRLGKNEKL